MDKLIVFCLLSIPVFFLSLRSLSSFKNHGFYRFFSWECILWLLVSNYKFWLDDPLSPGQVISWILLFASIWYVVSGSILMKKYGKAMQGRQSEALFGFEKTTELIDSGIFKYIRHPLYGSLIWLTWGIFLKNITGSLLLVAVVSTLFLYLTARVDEQECIQYFGEKYNAYMKRTKMFVPFLF